METSDRFERVDSICGPTPLQDGRNHSDEGFGTEERLDDETRHDLSVPIYPPHRRFLRFQWRGKIWEFKSLPFGIRVPLMRSQRF